MSEEIAISVKDVSKKYRLFSSPKERMKEALHPFHKQYHKEFWALKNVSFDIPKGQTLGILGRNGSGKSTLLQIIASVLQPTSGAVEVNGRVSALLELGAGFNPEFTGRDNVILNGAIQGIARDEMETRMPEIEAFADIGEFFDQPVKTYSSGMFVRVAFAAAIHCDPAILIIDETLAVGDTGFQAKCFDKLRKFQTSGRSIIVVSHDSNMITRLCDKAVVFDQGMTVYSGEVDVAIAHYDNLMSGAGSVIGEFVEECRVLDDEGEDDGEARQDVVKEFLRNKARHDRCHARRSFNTHNIRFGDGRAEVIDYLLVSGNEVDPVHIQRNTCVNLYVKVFFKETLEVPSFGMAIKTVDGTVVYGISSKTQDILCGAITQGTINVCRFSFVVRLTPGKYLINVGVDDCAPSGLVTSDCRRGIICLDIMGSHNITGLADLSGSIQLM